MEELFLRFPHLSEKIFDKLNNGSLSKSREINKSWNSYLSDEKWYEIRILKTMMIEMCPDIGDNVRKITNKWPRETIRDLKKAVCQLNEKKQWSNGRLLKQIWLARICVWPKIRASQGPPVHFAAAVGHQLFFETLFNVLGNNDKNPRNNFGETPLHFAAMNGHLLVCKYIMEQVTDKNPRADYGRTPLHYAAMNGHLPVCEYIMEQATDKNPRDNDRITALHFAAWNGHLAVCKYIMEQVTNKNPRDNDGKTPLHYAKEEGHWHVCEYIMRVVGDKKSRGKYLN